MTDDKEMIRKDLAVILKLDAQIDYSQKVIVEKYYKDIIQKGLLTTPHGKRYMKRLEQIINGDITYDKCVFCNSQTQGDSMICPVCMAKLRKPSTVYCRSCGNKMTANSLTCPMCGKDRDDGYKYCAHCGKEVPMPNVETFTNDIKNKSKTFAEQAAKITKENVQDLTERGTKIAENIAADAKTKKKSDNETGKHKKSILFLIVVLLIAVSIVGTIGFDTVFAFLAFVSLVLLIYKAVKKKPKKNTAIVFVVFLLLSGAAGMFTGNGVPDNVLDYIGTKESVVYQTYDKGDFYAEEVFGDWIENERRNKSGLPHIQIQNGTVYAVILDSGMNTSLNVGGLHIGDNLNKVETCMKKLNATLDADDYIPVTNGEKFGHFSRILIYTLGYKGKEIRIMITVEESIITRISCFAGNL